MNTITNIELNDIAQSDFVKLQRMTYTQSGQQKTWDIAAAHDSVAILIFNTDSKKFVVVKQFRPPVAVNREDNNGYTIEMCAGILDKNKSLEQTAVEEVFEETGYTVSTDSLIKIADYHTSVGTNGAFQTVYYVEVNDSMKTHEGGGIDTEEIEVLYVSLAEINEMLVNPNVPSPAGLQLAVYWYMLSLQV